MKSIGGVFVLLAVLLAPTALASSAAVHLDHMTPNLHDRASLQRGAQAYMNYCMGCHSLKYQRYERTADDIGVPHELMLEHLVFDPNLRIGALMDNNMPESESKNWFGAAPPDLTMINRVKGTPDWLFTYLRTFYLDDQRPFGVNNLTFPNVGMPHAMLELQGVQIKTCKQIPRLAANGGEIRDPQTREPVTEEVCGDRLYERGYSPLEVVPGTGLLTAESYDQVVYDLVNFLHYVGEPSRLERERTGYYVLFFLAFFLVFAMLLNREYWKDIH